MKKRRKRKKWEPDIIEWEPIWIDDEEHRKRLEDVSEIIYSLIRKSRRLCKRKSVNDSALEQKDFEKSKIQGAA